jgi:DNA-binding MurR/RpiR family transcriptional regulator
VEEDLDGLKRRLEENLPNLSKSQRRIADFLLNSHDEAAFLSAADLAERIEVSEATVVRFAQAIGYNGFPELKRHLQELYRAQVTPASRLQRKLKELASNEGHVLTKVIDMEMQYLAEAERSVSTADFDRAVEIILNGRRVFVRGGGPSAILADLMELRLRRFGIFALSMTESGRDLIEKLQLLRPNDVVVATGFHRVSNELAVVVEHARVVGCPTILITDTLGAVFHGKVDVVLAARRGPVSTFHSLTVPMAIMNALILAVAMARPDESLAALDQMQKMRAAYGFDVPGKVSP